MIETLLTLYVASVCCSYMAEMGIFKHIIDRVNKEGCHMKVRVVKKMITYDIGKSFELAKWIPGYNIAKAMETMARYATEGDRYLEYLYANKFIYDEIEIDPDFELEDLEQTLLAIEKEALVDPVKETIEFEEKIARLGDCLQNTSHHYKRLQNIREQYRKMRTDTFTTVQISSLEKGMTVHIIGGRKNDFQGIVTEPKDGIVKIDDKTLKMLGEEKILNLTLDKTKRYCIQVNLPNGSIEIQDLIPKELSLTTNYGRILVKGIPITNTSFVSARTNDKKEEFEIDPDVQPRQVQLKLKKGTNHLTYIYRKSEEK